MVVGTVVLILGCTIGGILWFSGAFRGSKSFNGPTATAEKKVLKVTIVARGSLEAAKNADIICDVRSGQKGSTIATTIKWVIDAGSEVRKGDEIMLLDDSGFDTSIQDQDIKVQTADAARIKAKNDLDIQRIDNDSELAAAKLALALAQLDYTKYIKGDYEQALQDVNGRIEMALSDYGSWFDVAANSQRMAKAGFITALRAESDQMRVQSAKFALEKVVGEKDLLEKYTKPKMEQDLDGKLEQAKLNLMKVQQQAESKIQSADAQWKAQNSNYEIELRRKREYESMKAKCRIVAPQDGLVVYYVSDQASKGGGTQQAIVAQGEPVREGQKLLQIPDLTKMQVNVRVPEALVSHLHNEDSEMSIQQAQIKIDAFPTRIFPGHVKIVDTVASQGDWFASDVKFYKTIVTLDQQMDGLKPGMSAEVTIYANESPTSVLVVPVQSVLGTISMGANRQCFVVDASGHTEKRDIVVGMSNERQVEIKSGLKEGEKVVLDPRTLLKEDSDLKPGKIRSKSNDDGQSYDAGTGDSKKDGKKSGKKKGDKSAVPPGPGPGFGDKAPPVAEDKKSQNLANLLEERAIGFRSEHLISNTPDASMPKQAMHGLRADRNDLLV